MGARGRLALINGLLTQQLEQTSMLNERIFSCILCGACEPLCPARVDITGAIYHGRSLLKSKDNRRRYLRFLMLFFIRRPGLSFRLARFSRYIGLSPERILAYLGASFKATIPSAPFRGRQHIYRTEKKIGRVAIFTGCSVNFLFPHLGNSLVRVLTHLGYEVILPEGEVCCGIPLRGLGMEKEAAELAEKNYEIFSRLKVDAILSLCPTCILAVNIHYRDLIGKGLEVMDVSVFLQDKLASAAFQQLRSFTSVTYHDPCHLSYSFGIKEEPRKVIRDAGAELIEAAEEGCCGFGGIFSLQYKEISGRLLKNRAEAYLNTGAEALITACPGCMLQLSRGMKGRRVAHIIELIEEAVCPERPL